MDTTKLTSLKMTHKEKQNHIMNIFIRSTAIYAYAYMSYLMQWPLWLMPLVFFSLYFSIYVSVHDIGHNTLNHENLSLLLWMIPVPTPIWGGTPVFANTHQRHHKYFCTDKDPWLHFYAGSPIKALVCNLFEPEINFYHYVKDKGFSAKLFGSLIFSVTFLALGYSLMGIYFLYFATILRIVHGLMVFFFNFYLHRSSFKSDAEYSTYSKTFFVPNKVVEQILKFIFGNDVLQGFIHHDKHHSVGQWHVQTKDYDKISNRNKFSAYINEWPVKKTHSLKNLEK